MSFKQIPLIDISKLYSDSLEDRKEVAQRIGDAAKNVGFLYVTGHRVPEKVIKDIKAESQKFFALPMETKQRYHIGSNGFHNGYVPEGEEEFEGSIVPDFKEAFDICNEVPADHELVKAGNPLLGPVNWPSKEVPGFSVATKAYYDEVMSLGKLLLQAFCLSLGLAEDHFGKYFNTPPCVLRCIRYPGGEDRIGIAEHSDYEFFTILLVDSPGLEVKNDDGEWIDAPPIPGSFVVNISDMLQHLTNGQLKATRHRVRAIDQERYSFPLFFMSDYETDVTPINGGEPVKIGDHVWSLLGETYKYLKKDGKAKPAQTIQTA